MRKEEKLIKQIDSDPMFFINKVLGKKMWSKQREIIYSVDKFPRTTVRGCHGFGKSFVAGNIILQFLYRYRPSIVLSTAPTYRQVEKLVWKEVRASYNGAKIPLGGTLQEGRPEIQVIRDQWYASGISTNDPNRFQGFHEENILIVVDEAAGVAEPIFEAIEGILTSKNARLLLIGNPTSTTGTFKKSFEEAGWNKIAVSAFDTPNFKALGITEIDIATGEWQKKFEASGQKLIEPKMITPAWVADKYKRWGPTSTLYKTRVLGNFDEEGSDVLIPLSWVEAAMQRWYEMEDEGDVELGADIAEFGRDSSIIAIKQGDKIQKLISYSKMKTMEIAGRIINIYNERKAKCVKIDTIGVGTGVEGRIEEQGYNTYRVNVSEAPGGNNDEEKKKYINKRSQLYWSLREALNPDLQINPNPLALPPDDELIEELAATKYKINSKGQIQVLPKENIKEIIGRSPDKADAVMLANAPTKLLETKRTIIGGTW